MLTVAELSTLLATDSKTTRRFLRSITPKENQPGKGGRWMIDENQFEDLRDKYNSYRAADEKRREVLQEKLKADRQAASPAIILRETPIVSYTYDDEGNDLLADIDTETIDLIDEDADLI